MTRSDIDQLVWSLKDDIKYRVNEVEKVLYQLQDENERLKEELRNPKTKKI
jgi:hypothetical protein